MYCKVYFILVHKNSKQLAELIDLLHDDCSLFFVHVDKKVDLHLFEDMALNRNCFFIKNRAECQWGTYSLVQATLNGMQEISVFMDRNHAESHYHLVLLSGDDLPLYSNDYINTFLINKIDISIIKFWKLPYENWWNGGLFRFENLYFFNFKKHPKSNYWLNRFLKKMHLNFLLPINKAKKYDPTLELFGGMQWMILSKILLKQIIEVSSHNHKFNKIFKYVLAPDEVYFPTLIHHFIHNSVDRIYNSPTHLVIFDRNDASPKYLSIEEVQKVDCETILFGRKFDPSKNQNTIDFVKNTISL